MGFVLFVDLPLKSRAFEYQSLFISSIINQEGTTNHSPSPSMLRREFLKKWIKCLRLHTRYYNSSKNMTILERKKAIKLSADVAMASASSRTNPTTKWSRALLISKNIPIDDDPMKVVVGRAASGDLINLQKNNKNISNYKKPISIPHYTKKILRRSNVSRRVQPVRGRCTIKTGSIAKKMAKNKTRVLRRLVPGGEHIKDDVSLCL